MAQAPCKERNHCPLRVEIATKNQGKISQFNWVLIQPIPEPLTSQKTSQVQRVSCTITEVCVEREFNKRGMNGMPIEIDP
ncbi:MAG: hypothetical protein LW720_13765, partial [Pirellula sp.]|nr:hypothetical protein [Pirellula sp.]